MKIFYLIGSLIVLSVLPMVVINNRVPRNIGIQNGQLSPMPKSPNAVSSQTEDPDKRVEPLPFIASPENSLVELENLILSYGERIVTRQPNYLHAVFTTKGLRFKDDVEFLVDREAEVVHFRSASRVGYSDMGVNRQRYEQIRQDYLSGND